MTCLVTFYSHFDAIRMRRRLADLGVAAALMPVPRDLSSSCGTCLRFETEEALPDTLWAGAERVVRALSRGYETLYSAEDSP